MLQRVHEGLFKNRKSNLYSIINILYRVVYVKFQDYKEGLLFHKMDANIVAVKVAIQLI
jgi:hypothetical protein